MKSFIVDKNKKLSKAVFSYIDDISFSAFQKALRNKDIKINGKRVSKDVAVFEGDVVEVYYSQSNIIYYTEIYRDENVLVINKSQGVSAETVYEKIKENYPCAGFIHRLDRNTFGIMIFSLNSVAEESLLQGFKNHAFHKEYTAEVIGFPKREKAILEGYLIKDEKSATVKVEDKPFKGAVYIKTGYEVIQKKEKTTILKVTLYTGKTHQIRAHLAHIGHPILGDGKYGSERINKDFKVNKQQLSSSKLTLKFNMEDPLYYLNEKSFTI